MPTGGPLSDFQKKLLVLEIVLLTAVIIFFGVASYV